MDLIYGNAVFTICAADGSNASTGLEAMDKATGTGSGDQHIADCTEDVRLMVSRPPEMYIKSSKWNTRAWTFQERLLSRRCLIFTGSRVYFQCRSTGMSEDIYADREGAGWSLDFMDAPLQTFRQLPLRSIWVYMKSVELYTARELTKDKDILAAFSGVANLMRETMNAPFIFGLPTSHFDLALLWDHPQPVQRRVAAQNASQGETIEFSSWSWSGWVGAAAEYRRDMLQGCLDNVSEWLQARTWIRWYIRDGNGDLRPLWDPYNWRVDASEQAKWKGYRHGRSSGSMLFQRQQRGRRISTSLEVDDYSETSSNDGLFLGNDDDSDSDPIHEPAVRIYEPAVRIYEPAVRIYEPAVSIYEPAVSIHEPAVSIHEPAVSIHEPAVSIHEPAVPIYEPADPTTHNESRRATVYQGGLNHESLPPSQYLLHHTSDELTESQQYKDSLSDAAENATSMLSVALNLVYRNEIGRFLIDILSALIRLAKVLLGIHVSSSGMPLDSHVETARTLEVQGSASRSKIATTPPSRSHNSRPTNREKRQSTPKGLKRRTAIRFEAERPQQRGLVQPENQMLQPNNTYREPREFLTEPPPHQWEPRNQVIYTHRRRSENTEQRQFHDLAFQPDSKVEPEHTESQPSFQITLNEYPYHPVIAPYIADHSTSGHPLMPILQFWTWHTSLYIQCPSQDLEATSLIRCNIADAFGDWCGSIVLDSRYISKMKIAKQEFIALSEAKKFTHEECEIWSYYVPKEREETSGPKFDLAIQ
jgi:hypothetical protein